LWGRFKTYMQWCYNHDGVASVPSQSQISAMWLQRAGGVGLMGLWYVLFGYQTDKYSYNPTHPYVFWLPMAGWLMLRNSSKYLCELHSGAMEFFGRITLETYVLQFHVFMCQNVQHIPIVVPGSGPEGSWFLKTLNMLVCGTLFVALAHSARHATVTTQTTVTELMTLVRHGPPPGSENGNDNDGDDDDDADEDLKDLLQHQSSSKEEKENSTLKDRQHHPSNENEGPTSTAKMAIV
jgi:10 TM Acyl Transferase domain found in Cas1p